jgi:hypothetical protein
MKYFLKTTLIALALTVTPIAVSLPAAAAVDFSVSLGNAAFGYTDGYWDRDHMWHSWQNKAQAQYYRAHNAQHYVAARHDKNPKDQDKGWRNENYWDKH